MDEDRAGGPEDDVGVVGMMVFRLFSVSVAFPLLDPTNFVKLFPPSYIRAEKP